MSAPFVRFFPIGLVLFTIVLAASLTDGAPRQHKCLVEECSQQFASSKNLMYHYFGIHPEHAATGTMYDNRYKCPIVWCPQGSAVFYHFAKLQEHCRTEHQYELKSEQRKCCDYCLNGAEGRLYWPFQLRDHIKTKHPNLPLFICEVAGCEQIFFGRSGLSRHQRWCLSKHQKSCDAPQHTLLTLESGEQSGRPGWQSPSASSNPIEPTTETRSSYQSPATEWNLSQLWSNRDVSGPGFDQMPIDQDMESMLYNLFAVATPDQPDPSNRIGTSFGTGPQYTETSWSHELGFDNRPDAIAHPSISDCNPQSSYQSPVTGWWSNRHVSGPGFQLWSNRHVSGPGFADAAPDQEGMLPDPSSSPAVDRHTGPWRTP